MTDARNTPAVGVAAADRQQTRASLIGFYLSCAGVAIGATVGAAGFLWFESAAGLATGAVITVLCSVTSYTSLRRMRR